MSHHRRSRPGLIPGGISARVLAAIRDGARTVGDIEADLDFIRSRHVISAHVHQLVIRGYIRITNRCVIVADTPRGVRYGAAYEVIE